jgi:hydroxypyruvate isomerase
MKISISVGAVFQGRHFCDSLHELKQLGVEAFEFWGWWDQNLAEIRATKETLGLNAAACCTHFISLVDDSQRSAYLAGLQESIQAAGSIGCKTLISQVGNDLGTARADQRRNLIDGLRACVPFLEASDTTLVIEPLNTLVDHPGYYLTSSDEAFDIVSSVGSSYVKVLFDIYHQQIMEGHVIRRIVANIDKIGHFHAAGNPGRHELYYGELNYPEIFRAIEATGYTGYVGFEYFPLDDPAKGIAAFLGKP